MRAWLVKQFKDTLRKSGRVIVPVDEYEESIQKGRYNWLRQMNIQTILDVGASDGGYARKIRQILPNAMIHSFEILPDSFEALNKRQSTDKYFKSYQIALSTYKGEIEFFRSGNSGSSSLLEMAELHKTSYPQSKNIQKIKVACDRLDNIITTDVLKPNVLLKLDLQGAEKIVLEGATGILDKVNIIYSEINFQELYIGAVLIDDLMKYLEKFNYRLTGIENVSQSLADGTFLQADAYFTKIS